MVRLAMMSLALLLTATAQAQTVYRWTDDDGLIHYGHAVPPEYRARGYDRLGRDGLVVEHIAPEMTPEERAREAARRAMQTELEAEQQNQATRDRLLLAAYRDEEELQDNLDWRLSGLRSQQATLETSLQHSRNRFENLVGQAANLDRRDQPVPESLRSSIDETRNEIRRLNDSIAELDQRKAEIRSRFEEDLERYRLLTRGPVRAGD